MRASQIQQRRIDANLCGNCGARPPKPGCVTCVHCLREKARTEIDLRSLRRERNRCPECGRRKITDRWGCKKCMTRHRANAARYREKQRAREQP